MTNELNHEKNVLKNNKNKNNDWAVLALLFNYLKHNRALIVSMLLLPVIFLILIATNRQMIFGNSNVLLMMMWLVQTFTFTIQNFLTILLDLKQTIIYRRIGLTGISKTKFMMITTIYNSILLFISHLLVFVGLLIILALKNTTGIANMWTWQLLINVLFITIIIIASSGFTLFLATIIKTRTGQTIANVITSFVIITPLLALSFFLNNISIWSQHITNQVGVGGVIGIVISMFLLINAISCLFYTLAFKLFKWFD